MAAGRLYQITEKQERARASYLGWPRRHPSSREAAELAYAAMRAGVAFLFLFHAPQKLFGWYGGPQYPAISVRGFASVIEVVTSPLIALGLFTSWAAAAAAAEMAGAYLLVHLPRGGWPIENRGEIAALYFLVFVYMGARGGGAYSVDRLRSERGTYPAGVMAAAMAAMLVLAVGSFARGSAPSSLQPARTVDSTARGVRLFVTNEGSGDLSVIDAATQSVVATAMLGKRPRGIKVSPDRKSLFVALSGSPNAGPSVDSRSLPPPDRTADGIGEVDVPSGHIVATVKVGDEPEGVAVRPDGKVVYVTSEAGGEVFVIDTATNTLLTKIAVGHRPRGIGFLPDGSRAYVTLENDGAITIIDGIRHRFVQLVPLEAPGRAPKPRPMGIAVRSDGSAVYVTTGSSGSMFFFNPATNQPTASLAVGQRPWGIALMPDGRTAYTANGPSNDVSVIDLQTHEVLKKIRVGERPWGVAIADYANVP